MRTRTKIFSAAVLSFALAAAGLATPAFAEDGNVPQQADIAALLNQYRTDNSLAPLDINLDGGVVSQVNQLAYSSAYGNTPSSYAMDSAFHMESGYDVHYKILSASDAGVWNGNAYVSSPQRIAGSLIAQYAAALSNPLYTSITIQTSNSPFYGVNTVAVVASAPDSTTVRGPDAVTPTLTFGATSARVSWQAPFDGGSPLNIYQVVLLNKTAGITTYKNVAANKASVLFTDIDRGNDYTATVLPFNTVGKRAASAPESALTAYPYTAPSAPANVITVQESETSIKGMWFAPTNDGGTPVDEYEVSLKRDGTTVQTVRTADLSRTFGNLDATSVYTISVAAINETGTGSSTLSNPLKIVKAATEATPVVIPTTPVVVPTTPATTAPAQEPTTPVVAPTKEPVATTTPSVPAVEVSRPDVVEKPTVKAASPTSVRVSWSAPNSNGSTIKGYTVSLTAAGKRLTYKAGATTRSHLFTGLPVGAGISVKVSATNAAGTSASPAGITARINTALPGKVAKVKASSIAKTGAWLAWSKPATNGGAKIKGYTIQIKRLVHGKWRAAQAYTTTHAYTNLANLRAGAKYSVQVTAYNTHDSGYRSGFHGSASKVVKLTTRR